MAEIALAGGGVALIDDEDLEKVKGYSWRAATTLNGTITYAVSEAPGGESVSLHRLIMDAPSHLVVDHANCNGLDCRKDNLRLATRSQNCGNTKTPSHNTSGFKGVSRASRGDKWQAIITVNYKRRHLGYFDTPEDAARAYNEAAAKERGEFARGTPVALDMDVSHIENLFELTSEEAEFVALHAGQGFAYADVAQRMGVSLAKVRDLADAVRAKVVERSAEVQREAEPDEFHRQDEAHFFGSSKVGFRKVA